MLSGILAVPNPTSDAAANTTKASCCSGSSSVEQLIAQKKMKKPYDPDKYLELSFISNTIKQNPRWFADLPAAK